jgi:hypothetical protein
MTTSKVPTTDPVGFCVMPIQARFPLAFRGKGSRVHILSLRPMQFTGYGI